MMLAEVFARLTERFKSMLYPLIRDVKKMEEDFDQMRGRVDDLEKRLDAIDQDWDRMHNPLPPAP